MLSFPRKFTVVFEGYANFGPFNFMAGHGLTVIVAGSCVSLLMSLLSVCRSSMTIKEKLFVSCASLPKTALQVCKGIKEWGFFHLVLMSQIKVGVKLKSKCLCLRCGK